ncbi:hypothetical protein B0H10DRAFT_2042300 [Mycena sp. CBHHK59/15]|nr:hypothetical protein B0H10DRAFT_2042300 [Mycena sp. CBHHK59/15]
MMLCCFRHSNDPHSSATTELEPRSSLQKRKRDDGLGSEDYPIAGPSRMQEIPGRNMGSIQSETKKARKRRRRLEREEAMAHSRAQALAPPFPALPFAFNAWPSAGPAFNPYHLSHPVKPTPLKPLGSYPERGGYPMSLDTYPPRLPPLTFPNPQQYVNGYPPKLTAPPSTWVSSMTMAAAVPPPKQDLDIWDSYPAAAHLPRAVDPPPPPPPLPPPTQPVPPKKPVSLIIGMNPDQDPHSKHGTFHHSTHTITSLPSNPPNGDAYIPNPARSIVMEQLGKTSRTQDFINSWSKSACGAYPVYFAIDPPSAKALIEFATAELARKAWGSPKLSTGGVGPAIKGKPRNDLIRVWWYRVDGVGAGAGVGEIEEGEIEGDAAEREVSVPPETVKKETKKERKARLAREREAKMVKTQQDTPMTPAFAPDVAIVADDAMPAASYAAPALPPREVAEGYSSLSPAWAPDSPLPAYGDHNPTWPTDSFSQDVPPATDSHSQSARSRQARALLPPQSQLETQWQPRYPPTRKPEWGTVVSASATPLAAAPPSPFLRDTQTIFADDVQMDVDADMEMETPVSGNFPHPLPSRPPSHIAPASSHVYSDPAPPQRPPSSWPVSALPTPTPTPPPPLPSASSASSRSSPALSTPPLEPRAMKNAPKGPSFAKRSLVARHKDLEERIARGKLEIGLKGLSTDKPPLTTPSAPPALASVDVMEDVTSAATMEDNLRLLVLKSQKSKTRSTLPMTHAPSPPITISTASSSTDSAASSSAAASPSSATFPAAIPTPSGHAAPPPPPRLASTNASLKQELAAKQKRLEQNIAESKTLMAQLAAARTKQEKDRILTVMRERSRMMEEETQQGQSTLPQPAGGAASAQPKQSLETPVVAKLRWPESRNDVCVLIISDDEDDGDEDD